MKQPYEIRRRYHPVHNVGHFRYLECSHLTDDGEPAGDVTVWDEIRFPFDPALQDANGVAVERSDAARSQQIEEKYSSDASGTVTVTITNLTRGVSAAISTGTLGRARRAPDCRRTSRSRHTRGKAGRIAKWRHADG